MKVEVKKASLNKTEVRALSSIRDPKARAAAKLDMLQKKQVKIDENSARYQEIVDRRQNTDLEISLAESGDAIVIRNSGTKFSFLMLDAKHARQLVAQFKTFSKLVSGLNTDLATDIDVEVEADESEQA